MRGIAETKQKEKENKVSGKKKSCKNDLLYRKKSTVISSKLIFYIAYLSRIINDLQIILNINACLAA